MRATATNGRSSICRAIFQRLSLLTLSEADRAFIVSTSDLASLHLARKAVKLVTQLGHGFAKNPGAHQPDG